MVRSLAIRQFFVIVDFALTVLIVLTAGMVVMQVLEPPPLISDLIENAENPAARNVQLAARTGDRSQYDRILASALFGDAGRWDPGAEPPPPPPPPPPSTDLEDTQLNLRLLGTVALSPEDPFASAVIENADLRTKGGYGLGQEVVEKVKLLEVYPREVILLNERNTPPTRERLRMDEDDMSSPPPQVAQSAMPVRSGSIEQITLDRMDMVNEIMRSYSDLVTKVKPEPYRDANGRIIGLTAGNISQIPLAGKLGLTDNDVLQTVNNEPIDSMEKIYEIFNRYGNANSIRIGILRDGKPKIITYNLR